MIKRRICQLCVLWVILLSVAYVWDSRRFFKELNPSTCEVLFQNGDTAHIIGDVYKKEEGLIYIKELKIYLKDRYVAAEERLPVYLAEEDACHLPKIGQHVLVSGIIKTIQDSPNPGNFNQKSYYQKQDIHIMLQKARIVDCEGEASFIQESIWQIREKLDQYIIDTLGEHYGSILSAMLCGKQTNVNREVKELYQKSGIGHLLSISGLHMSFLGMGVFELLKKMGIHKYLASILSIGVLTFYIILI